VDGPLIVEEGRILCYRLLDVGDAIALDVDLGRRCLELPAPHATVEADISARLYGYGAVSVRLEIPIPRLAMTVDEWSYRSSITSSRSRRSTSVSPAGPGNPPW
jgi:hypothetical protein